MYQASNNKPKPPRPLPPGVGVAKKDSPSNSSSTTKLNGGSGTTTLAGGSGTVPVGAPPSSPRGGEINSKKAPTTNNNATNTIKKDKENKKAAQKEKINTKSERAKKRLSRKLASEAVQAELKTSGEMPVEVSAERKQCPDGLQCKSLDPQHFLLFQHTPQDSSAATTDGNKQNGDAEEDDGDNFGTTVIRQMTSTSSGSHPTINNDADGYGTVRTSGGASAPSSTDTISLTMVGGELKTVTPTGVRELPSFRTAEDWELNLIALERGEWVEGQMSEDAFGRYHKKAKRAVKNLFSDEEQRRRERERLAAARERLQRSAQTPRETHTIKPNASNSK